MFPEDTTVLKSISLLLLLMLTANPTAGMSALLPKLASEQQADRKYQLAPVRWAVEKLGIPAESIIWSMNEGYEDHVWDGTPDPLAELARAIARGEDTGVESATGTGKTYELGWLALWFCACFEDSLVITTAPKEGQLTTQLWKEIGRHWPKFKAAYPNAETVQLRVRMKPGKEDQETWAIVGYACGVEAGAQSATRAQGFHAPHMLIMTEETPGIDQAVMTAFENTCTGTHNIRLAVGNPDHQLDTLHRFCTSPGVTHIRISALDHPNVVSGKDVIPGACSRKSIERAKRNWGEGSPMYESRVRGVSPKQAVNALIRLDWCEAAAARWEKTKNISGFPALGVDVAQSENGDKAAIAKWNGARLESVTAFQCPNATDLGTDVHTIMKAEGIPASSVGVDSVGIGAATVNELARLTTTGVRALSGGMPAMPGGQKDNDGTTWEWVPDANNFNNLRSQMYWQLREDLRLGRVSLPPDPLLFRELTTPTFEPVNGKVQVESKQAIKKRLGNSPDRADAVVYGNWVRPRSVEEGEKGTGQHEDKHILPPSVKKEEAKARYQMPTHEDTEDHEDSGWRVPT